MKSLEELCLELKNDFLSEIRDNKNWDIAEFPMKFYASGGGEGGLFILKRDGQETGRVSHKKFTEFFSALRKLVDPTKTNKGTITIYPNGEYVSSFIWDNEVHLATLFGVEDLFSIIYEEIRMCNIFFNAEGSSIPWDNATVIISFKSGKVQPLEVEIKSGEKINHHFVPISDEYGESEYQLPKKVYEDVYHLTNEGELKGTLSQKWNVAIISIKNAVDFDFDRDIKLEWREENA